MELSKASKHPPSRFKRQPCHALLCAKHQHCGFALLSVIVPTKTAHTHTKMGLSFSGGPFFWLVLKGKLKEPFWGVPKQAHTTTSISPPNCAGSRRDRRDRHRRAHGERTRRRRCRRRRRRQLGRSCQRGRRHGRAHHGHLSPNCQTLISGNCDLCHP